MSSNNISISSSPIPAFSKESQKALKKIISEQKETFSTNGIKYTSVSYYYYPIQNAIDQMESYKRSYLLKEEIEKTPIKAKVLSILAASVIIALIVGAAIGSHYAKTMITDVGGSRGAAIFGIIAGAVVVTNVVGGIFNYRWKGVEWERANYAAPIIMSFAGIVSPLWRAFGHNINKTVEEDHESAKKAFTNVYPSICKLLKTEPDSAEKTKLETELDNLNKFFNPSNEV